MKIACATKAPFSLQTIVLVVVMTFISIPLIAQERTNSAGGTASGATGTVSYSIGLVDYITASGSNGLITQGLQQSYEIFLVGLKDGAASSGIAVYPIPVGDFAIVDIGSAEPVGKHVVLHDLHGKLLYSSQLNGSLTQIPLVDLAGGSYLLRVIESDGKSQTFKLIKN